MSVVVALLVLESQTCHSAEDTEGTDLPGSEAALRPVPKQAFTYTLILTNKENKYVLMTAD